MGIIIKTNSRDPRSWAEAFARGWFSGTELEDLIGKTTVDPEVLKKFKLSYDDIGLPPVAPWVVKHANSEGLIILTEANIPDITIYEVHIRAYTLPKPSSPAIQEKIKLLEKKPLFDPRIEIGEFRFRYALIPLAGGVLNQVHIIKPVSYSRPPGVMWTRHKFITIEPVPFAIMRTGTDIEHSSRFLGGRFKTIELYYAHHNWFITAWLALGLKPDGNIYFRISKVEVIDNNPDIDEDDRCNGIHVNPIQHATITLKNPWAES